MVYDACPGATAVLLQLLLGCVRYFKFAARVTHNTAKSHVPGITLLPQKRTADPLIRWFSPQRGCAIWEIFRYVCNVSGFHTRETTLPCVAARNKSYPLAHPVTFELPLPETFTPNC